MRPILLCPSIRCRTDTTEPCLEIDLFRWRRIVTRGTTTVDSSLAILLGLVKIVRCGGSGWANSSNRYPSCRDPPLLNWPPHVVLLVGHYLSVCQSPTRPYKTVCIWVLKGIGNTVSPITPLKRATGVFAAIGLLDPTPAPPWHNSRSPSQTPQGPRIAGTKTGGCT